jgi:hypothetical protein
MKKISLLIIMCLFSLATVAQTYHSTPSVPKEKKIKRIGLQTGFNMPQMVFTEITDQEFYPQMSTHPKFNLGFYSETGTSDYFVMAIGLFYSGAGFRTDDNTTSLDYITIPWILNFRAPIAGAVALLIGAGPYGSYAFNGIEKYDNGAFIDRNILSLRKEDTTKNKPYLMFDGGLIFSGGVEYKLNNDNLLKLGVSYNFGILNLSNPVYTDFGGGNYMEVEGFGARNRVLSINLAYMFDLKSNKL